MAENQRDGVTPLLVGVGIAAGVGAIVLLVRALRPPFAAAEAAVTVVKEGATDAAQAVADFLFGVEAAGDVIVRTNEIVAEAEAQIQASTDELERLRLRLVQLEASRAEVEALGGSFGLQPSVDSVRARIAVLEAGGV